jgi:hypothetical protein
MASRWPGLTWLVALAALPALPACGTDAVGVDTCRQIEEARCQQAPACGISLEPPYRTSGTDVAACVRFYDDECLHGLVSGHDPGPILVGACVAAIRGASTTDGGCAVVLSPASVAACGWLAPNSSASDASSSSPEAAVGDGSAAD